MIVDVDEGGVDGDAFGLAEVVAGVDPFLTPRPVEPFHLAAGLWPEGSGPFVRVRAESLGEEL